MASSKNQAVRPGRSDAISEELGAGRRALRRALRAGSVAALAGTLAVAVAGPLAAPVRAGTTGEGPDAGYVLAWGDNTYGQTDVPEAAHSGIVAISAGRDLAMALTWDGKVIAWGDNTYGQTDVPAGLSNVKAISAGDTFAVALKANGAVVAWGDDSHHQTEVPAAAKSGVVAVSAGNAFVVALKSDGSIVAWGNDYYGATDIPWVVVPHGSLYMRVPLANLKSVSTRSQVLGLRQDGTVIAWGWDDFGQADVPADLSGITAVAAGGLFSLALESNGAITGWGNDMSGQLDTPCAIWVTTGCLSPVTGFSAIAAGTVHALALKDGYIYAWGDNGSGQTTLPSLATGFSAVAAGANFSLALYGTPSSPGAPYGASAVAGDKSAQVSWQGGSDNGVPVTSYTVTSLPGGKTCVTSGLSCTVTGLVNGKAYTFTVTATNGLGTGPASAPTTPVKPKA